MKMENCCVRLNDLPVELLVIIFRKLNNFDLFYSLLGINRQFDRILNDPLFTNDLRLVRSSPDNVIHPLSSTMMDRFCLEILPQIHEKIRSLTVESLHMEDIFRAGGYPNLRKLCLMSIKRERLVDVLNDENYLLKKFANTISTFSFSITAEPYLIIDAIAKIIIRNILKLFVNLTDLRFSRYSSEDIRSLSFRDEIPMFSSTLLELHIIVSRSSEFLSLLDGRLSHLHTLYVEVETFFRPSVNIDMKKRVSHLKKFSLIGILETWFYNETILPILHRMSNLEILFLSLIIDHKQFIDGNRLQNDIVNHLPKLNEFTFNIHSRIYNYKQSDIRSNEDIQRTFEIFSYHEVISCVDCFPEERYCQCHYYSYPYRIPIYENLTNNFPGGLFPCVCEVCLFDERPYEHRFFLQLSKSFPFLRQLTIENFKAQNEKFSSSNNGNLPMIEYSSLTELNLLRVHDDYIEEFLLDSKALIQNYLTVSVNYDCLSRVTNHFTRDETRINSAKIKDFSIPGHPEEFSDEFFEYFSSLETYRVSLVDRNSDQRNIIQL